MYNSNTDKLKVVNLDGMFGEVLSVLIGLLKNCGGIWWGKTSYQYQFATRKGKSELGSVLPISNCYAVEEDLFGCSAAVVNVIELLL